MAKRLTNFRLETELLDALERVRDRDGVSVSEQVRRAIQMWLKSKGEPLTPPTRKRPSRRGA